jgi:hypothetical protein
LESTLWFTLRRSRSLSLRDRTSSRIRNQGFKFSYAIYTTFFTGRIPTNYFGATIESDSLFAQMSSAGMRTAYVGPHRPTIFLLGDDWERTNADYFHRQVNLPEETVLFSHLFAAENHTAVTPYRQVQRELDSVRDRGESLFIGSGLMDKVHHELSKNSDLARALIAKLLLDLMHVVRWCEENPDYLLILSSDHGGATYVGEDAVDLHGPCCEGNEGFVSFFSPRFQTSSSAVFPLMDTGSLTEVSPCSLLLSVVCVCVCVMCFFCLTLFSL